MKKFILSAVILVTITACGGGDTTKKDETTTTTAPPSSMVTKPDDGLASNPVYAKGLELAAQNQCPTCHKIDEKLTGPAYREVANKYAGADDATITKLAKKVIEGGSGVWGEVPMTPHPGLSEDDAKSIVKYILLLKK